MVNKVDTSEYSEELKEKIYEVYKEVKRQDAVAKVLNIPRDICRAVINYMKQKEHPKATLETVLKEYDFIVPKECINNLQRDYWKNPIKRGELPIKEDLEYLYHTLNLPLVFVKDFFQVSDTTIKTWCKKLGIPDKTKLQGYEVSKIMNLHKYGQETTTGLPWVQEKTKQTNIAKYGVDNPMKSKEIQQRYIDTCVARYGVTNTAKLSETQAKMKTTSIERYGVPNIVMTEENKQYLRDIFPQTLEKMKKTNLEKYGYEHTLQVPEIRQQGEQTCLEKYGVRFASQSPIIREKVDNTLKTRENYSKSEEEDYVYELLRSKFGEDDIIRQHKTDEYPSKCDFYIISLDLYIEYQGYWKHGGEPFDETNPNHLTIVAFWEQKSKEIGWHKKEKKSYKDAIYIWTVSDPLKRETARKNNLNWIEFFNMEQFMEWFNSLPS